MSKRQKNILYTLITIGVLFFFTVQSTKNDLFSIKKSVDNSHKDILSRTALPTDIRRYNENAKLYNETLNKFPHRIIAKKYSLKEAALK